MQKGFFLFFLFSVLFVLRTSAQSAKSVYAELGGPGIASFNFDARFNKKEDGLGGRIGIGGFSVDHSGIVVFPIGLNYLMSKDQKNYFELGAGYTPIIGTGNLNGDGTFSSSFGSLWFGYRLQPLKGGFSFRAGMCPVFGNGFFVPYYFGLSFGYKF